MQCCGSASNSTTIATPARLTEQSKSNIWDGQWASNFRRQLRMQIFWASTTQLKKKDLIKISTLTLSSVAVLQAALQLPLQQDSQSRPEVKHWDWHPTARSSWDTILWSKRTDVSIQYRGREVMYCILYKETSNCREMEYFWARDPAEHKMWCFYSTHTGSNIGDKLQKGAILWSLHSSPVVPHTLMENCRRERQNRRLQY